jgi:ASPIC and UnbV/FG-GAP-like repeat
MHRLLSLAVSFALATSPVAVPSQLTESDAYQSSGTKKMSALLEQIYREQDWKTDPSKDAERAEYLRNALDKNPSVRDELRTREVLAENLLRSGDSAGAVEQLERIRALCKQDGIILTPAFDKLVSDNLAISYLRLGEQENCVHFHGQDSCRYPIQGGGVHVARRGAEGAFRELMAALEKDPNDLNSRWLLNIATMTLGKYPDAVPTTWRIPPSNFKSEYDIGRFRDVATDVGLIVNNHAGGVIMEDFDGDGLLDLMVSGSGPHDQLRLFHNNGDGTFSDRTRKAGLTGETGGLNLVLTDYNNDRYPDVLVLRGGWWGQNGKYPMSLLRNNGNGTFDDVTEEAGLMSLYPTQTAAWADYDNDGWLDLYVGHEAKTTENHPSQLFHNNHDGTFTEIAAPNGLADMGFVKGVAWGDFNKDGRPDLYLSVYGKANRLFRNDGPMDPTNPRSDRWKFTDVANEAGVVEPMHGFATWFFDYDNDGWPDLFVAGFHVESLDDIGAFQMGLPHNAEVPRLYHNNHDGTFTDVTKRMHLDRAILVMGANFGDLDNDGWLDVYLGTGDVPYRALLPNRMFRNKEGTAFQDVTTSGGFGHLQKGHGIAFGDIDNDGDEDVFEEMGGAASGDSYPSALYENPGHGNHWVTLELEGLKTNRAAFGARVRVTVKTEGNVRQIYRTVGYRSSFGGNPLRQHIGVGKADRIAEIEVWWPTSNSIQTFRDVAVDRAFHVREGDPTLRSVQYKTFQLRGIAPIASSSAK